MCRIEILRLDGRGLIETHISEVFYMPYRQREGIGDC